MKKPVYLSLLAILIAALSSTQATTVIPPTFDELVSRAEVIFQGNVTDVKSQWVGEGADRHIVSYVTFQVEDALKGAAGQSYTLRMFGGVVDGQGMAVAEAPQFSVGDKDILFVENNGSQIIPLVGVMHGRFHVQLDQSGREVVLNSQGESVKNLAQLGKQLTASDLDSNAANLTPADFKAAVKAKLQAAQ